MTCDDRQNKTYANCGDSAADIENRGPSGRAEGCIKTGAEIQDTRESDFCTFYGKGHCSLVCGCNNVIKCHSDCKSYQASSKDPRITQGIVLNRGDEIQANQFKTIINKINQALRVVKLNKKQINTPGNIATNNTIQLDDVDDIVSTYNNVFDDTNSGIAGCNSRLISSSYINENFLSTDNTVNSHDWNDVLKHILYLTTCCHCVSDYKLVCKEVCVCSCFY